MSERRTLLVPRKDIESFLGILDGLLIKSKLTLYDHYNSKFLLAEESIVLVCELVAVAAGGVKHIEENIDLLSEEEEVEVFVDDLSVATQLFLRSVEISESMRKRNIFYDEQ